MLFFSILFYFYHFLPTIRGLLFALHCIASVRDAFTLSAKFVCGGQKFYVKEWERESEREENAQQNKIIKIIIILKTFRCANVHCTLCAAHERLCVCFVSCCTAYWRQKCSNGNKIRHNRLRCVSYYKTYHIWLHILAQALTHTQCSIDCAPDSI